MEKDLSLFNKIVSSNIYNKIKNFSIRIFYSDIYVILVFLLSLINWSFNLKYFIYIMFFLLFLLIYIFKISRIKLIPILFAFIIANSDKTDITSSAIFFAVFSPFIIYDFIICKLRLKNSILYGMIFILIAMFFSLQNTPLLLDSIRAIANWIIYIIIYIYIYSIKDFQEDLESSQLNLGRIVVYFGIALMFEILIYYFKFGLRQNIVTFFGSAEIDFGWGKANTISMLFLLVIPLSLFYFIKNQDKYYILFAIFFNIIFLSLMLSRGAYIAVAMTILPVTIRIMMDVKERENLVIAVIYTTIIILLLLLFIAIPSGLVKNILEIINSRSISFDSQNILNKIGYNVFKQSPLFGGGINSSSYYLAMIDGQTKYKNIYIQTLAEIGIIGFIAFIYYLSRIFSKLKYPSTYNVYVIFVALNMLVQGLFDNTIYTPIIMIIFSIIFPLTNSKKLITQL